MKTNQLKRLTQTIRNQGGEVKQSTSPGALYVELPGIRNEDGSRFLSNSVVGLLWLAQKKWEILGGGSNRDHELVELFSEYLPTWERYKAPSFSDLVRKPSRLGEFYRGPEVSGVGSS